MMPYLHRLFSSICWRLRFFLLMLLLSDMPLLFVLVVLTLPPLQKAAVRLFGRR